MKKIILIITIIILLFLVIFLLAKNIIIKNGIIIAVKKGIGLELEIDKMDIGILNSKIKISGLNIHNPEGFTEKYLAKIPLIYVDYELGSLLSKKFHSTKIEINIEEIIVEKNKNKILNLNKLKEIASSSETKTKQPKQQETKLKLKDLKIPQKSNLNKLKDLAGSSNKKSKQQPTQENEQESKDLGIQIDELILTANQVRYVNSKKSGSPKVKTVKIGLDHEKFNNLKSIGDIIKIVTLKTAMAAGLSNIGLNLKNISSGLLHIDGDGMSSLKKTKKSIKNFFQKKKKSILNRFIK